jgi:hypothetical protein
MSLSRIRPVGCFLLVPVALSCVLAGTPETATAATTSDAVITGTVTFHEATPDPTIEVFRDVDGAWTEDPSLETDAASDGSYAVHPPAGEPVKLRVSYGSAEYGYWYGDGFAALTAVPVLADDGTVVTDVDLNVPAPAWVSGRVTNKAGSAIAAKVTPMVNNDGGLRPLTSAPITTTSTGAYTVILPAGYDTAVRGTSTDGRYSAWLGGGGTSEPNSYLALTAGEHRPVADLVIPAAAAATPAATTRLKATGAPVVSGAARKGATLKASRGTWNLAPTAVRYQWLRNGKVIRSATRANYKLTRADIRKRVSVKVTASRTGVRNRGYALSARTAVVRAR